MDGGKNVRIDDLSKLTKVEHLREKIEKYFDVDPVRQRLFYRGKQVGEVFVCVLYLINPWCVCVCVCVCVCTYLQPMVVIKSTRKVMLFLGMEQIWNILGMYTV